MSETKSLDELVNALPERYQPVFGHPELSGHSSRKTDDRLAIVLQTHELLRTHLGRSVRVLDLGCAQGYMSLTLAEAGAVVTGVDFLPANIELCKRLAEENGSLDAKFIHASVQDFIRSLEEDRYDLVLAFSVLHHVAFAEGHDAVKRIIEVIRTKSRAVLLELALRDEPLYWAPALPDDPVESLEGAGFVKKMGVSSTHLSDVVRPIFFLSDSLWLLGGYLGEYDRVLKGGHKLAPKALKDTRTYYLSKDLIAKKFSLASALADVNTKEIANEAKFLSDRPAGIVAPALIASGVDDDCAWLVREKMRGQLLSDLIDEGAKVDYYLVIRDILGQCIALESRGLYHQDIRVWNILLCEDGVYRLIDFGSISPDKRDCVWPENIYIAFLVFIKELISGEVSAPEPIRDVAVTPFGFPGHLSRWVSDLSQVALDSWSFERMLQELETCFLDPGTVPASLHTVSDAFAHMVEEALSVLTKDSREKARELALLKQAATDLVGEQAARISNVHHDTHLLWKRVEADASAMDERLGLAMKDIVEIRTSHVDAASKLAKAEDEFCLLQQRVSKADDEFSLLQQRVLVAEAELTGVRRAATDLDLELASLRRYMSRSLFQRLRDFLSRK